MVKITKAVAAKWSGDVPQEKQFCCLDGRLLKNLPELEVALREMSEETFRHHSNEAKNDFSSWVRDVIGDEKLSRDLRKATSQGQTAKVVNGRIAWLREKIAAG